MKYLPRNDFVLVCTESVVVSDSGIALPEASEMALVHHVVAVGPEVRGLKAGDEVLLGYDPRTEVTFGIQREKSLSLVHEKHVICKVTRT